MAKMKIKTYRLVRQDDLELDIQIPQEQSFYFETFVRRSICITPVFTTWNVEKYSKPEEIYKLEVVCVYLSQELKIEQCSISVFQIEHTYNHDKEHKTLECQIIKFLMDFDSSNKRTKEKFLEDYNKAIGHFKNIIDNKPNL